MRILSKLIHISLLIGLCTLPRATAGSTHEVNGILREVNGLEVLTVWGTPYEMGYAHGLLLGPRIMEIWDKELIQGYWEVYPALLEEVVEYAYIMPHHLEELNGVLSGMADNPDVELYVPELGREFGLQDLIVLNCAEFHRCEAMTIWGELTPDGSTLTANNFGYSVVPYSYRGTTMLDNTILVAYDPSRLGARRYVTVSWPGIIGCVSSMNEEGVTVFIHNGEDGIYALESPNPPIPNSLSPSILVMREMLEVGDCADPVYAAFEMLESVRLFKGWIIMVASPFGGGDTETAGVIEADADGQVLRLSSDNYPQNPNRIFASTTYQKYHHVRYDIQYRALEMGVRLVSGVGGKKINNTAVEGIMALAASAGGISGTQHSVVFHPHECRFETYVGEIVGGVLKSAIFCESHRFVWSDLWP